MFYKIGMIISRANLKIKIHAIFKSILLTICEH
jgi:hypothetical protein